MTPEQLESVLSVFWHLIERELDRLHDTHQEENIQGWIDELVRITGLTEQQVKEALPL